MKYCSLLIAFIFFLAPTTGKSQEKDLSSLPWQMGPTTGQIGEKAVIQVPEGFAFLGADGTRKLNVIFENPDDGSIQYTIAPKSLDWVAFFQFQETGYVKDNETLDANAILSSVREGTEQSNEERRKQGWDPMHVTGWAFEPRYDKSMNALEWAIIGESERSKARVVNYNTRLLGRRGVMSVTVVANPDKLAPSVAAFKGLLPGYKFVNGETYAEYRAGDHVAAYGLTALITGGAVAVAAKKGLFGVIGAFLAAAWKFVLAAIVGVGAWFKSLFSGRKAK